MQPLSELFFKYVFFIDMS